MAKDFLAVPISGVGVERLSSSVMQICSYAQNRLKPSTIGNMMVVKHAEGNIARKEKNCARLGTEEEGDGGTDNGHDTEGDYDVAEKQLISDDEEEEGDDYDDEEETEEAED